MISLEVCTMMGTIQDEGKVAPAMAPTTRKRKTATAAGRRTPNHVQKYLQEGR